MAQQNDIGSILTMTPNVIQFIDMMLERKLKEREQMMDDATSDDLKMLIQLLLKEKVEEHNPRAVPTVRPIGDI